MAILIASQTNYNVDTGGVNLKNVYGGPIAAPIWTNNFYMAQTPFQVPSTINHITSVDLYLKLAIVGVYDGLGSLYLANQQSQSLGVDPNVNSIIYQRDQTVNVPYSSSTTNYAWFNTSFPTAVTPGSYVALIFAGTSQSNETSSNSHDQIAIGGYTGAGYGGLWNPNNNTWEQIFKSMCYRVYGYGVPQSISGTSVSSITSTSAYFSASVSNENGASITQKGFIVTANNSNPTLDSNPEGVINMGGGTGSAGFSEIYLGPGTTYYVRFFATNAGGTNYGAVTTFTTLNAPSLRTLDATPIGVTTASIYGNVDSDGGTAVFERGARYGLSSGSYPYSSTNGAGSGTGYYGVALTGLTPYTTYYSQAYAVNSVGTSYGGELSFTTLSGTPTVTSGTVSNTIAISTDVSATVNSDNGSTITQRGFCYGTSPNPTIAGTKQIVSGTTGTFSATLSGLTPSTLYYIQPYATNANGTVYGSQLTVTTLAGIPSVSTGTVSSTTSSGLAISGSVDNQNGGAITERGFVWNSSGSATKNDHYVIVTGSTGSYSGNVTGWVAATSGFVRAYAINSFGVSYGSDVAFRTLPGNPTSLIATVMGKTQINLSWNKGSGSQNTVIRRGIGAYPATVTDGTAVYNGADYSYNDTGLTSGVTYYYRVWSLDGTTNYGAGTADVTAITIKSLTNPTNAQDTGNSSYATVTSTDNKIYIKLSKDGGNTWQSEIQGTLPGSNGVVQFGSSGTELWGTSWIGTDVNNTNLRAMISFGSDKKAYQIFKTFGIVISGSNNLTGIEVDVKGYYSGGISYIDSLGVICHYGTSNLPIKMGTQAYDSTQLCLSVFDGNNWIKQLETTDISTSSTLSENSDAKVASQKATKTYADTKIASSYIDTDGTLTANSDSKIASQKATKTYVDTYSGWNPSPYSVSYVSSPATGFYIVNFAGDITSKLHVGDRVRLTHSSTVKMFKVGYVGAYASSVTPVTLFGGTDYTLTNSALSAISFSHEVNPEGFNNDPLKWTVSTFTDSQQAQATPGDNTYYTPGNIGVTIGAGLWKLGYKCSAIGGRSTAGDSSIYATLYDGTSYLAEFTQNAYNLSVQYIRGVFFVERDITTTAASTTYRIAIKAYDGVSPTLLRLDADQARASVWATFAF